VGSLTDRRCWCWGWNLYLCFSIFVLFRVCMSFHRYTFLLIGVRQTAGARLNSCYTQALAGNPCVLASVYLSSMYSFVYSLFQVLLISFLYLLLPSILFVSRYLGENPLRSECDQV